MSSLMFCVTPNLTTRKMGFICSISVWSSRQTITIHVMNQSLGHLTFSLPRFDRFSCPGTFFKENTLIQDKISMNYSWLLRNVISQVCLHGSIDLLHSLLVFWSGCILFWEFHNIQKDARLSLKELFCFWKIKLQLNA